MVKLSVFKWYKLFHEGRLWPLWKPFEQQEQQKYVISEKFSDQNEYQNDCRWKEHSSNSDCDIKFSYEESVCEVCERIVIREAKSQQKSDLPGPSACEWGPWLFGVTGDETWVFEDNLERKVIYIFSTFFILSTISSLFFLRSPVDLY